jgi:hypothetical protein
MDDLYEETVLNPDGSIYHHNAEPLREHRHHGADKPKTERSLESPTSPARRPGA